METHYSTPIVTDSSCPCQPKTVPWQRMNKRLTLICGLFLLAASLILAAYFYPLLPETLASHWDAQGNADDTMPKFWSLFLFPMIIGLLLALCFGLPFLDPLKKNIDTFRATWNALWVVMMAFFFYVFILTLIWHTGTRFNFGQAIVPAVGVLFFAIGTFLTKTKRNWMFGVRTPWTLSSDKVWDKTHKLGSILFKVSGVITILGFLLPEQAIFLAIIPIAATAIITVIYSWVVFYQEEKK